MTSNHGRATMIAVGWIAIPLLALVGVLSASVYSDHSDWAGVVTAVLLLGAGFMAAVAILVAAFFVHFRMPYGKSAAGVGAQGGLLGLTVAVLALVGYLALR